MAIGKLFSNSIFDPIALVPVNVAHSVQHRIRTNGILSVLRGFWLCAKIPYTKNLESTNACVIYHIAKFGTTKQNPNSDKWQDGSKRVCIRRLYLFLRRPKVSVICICKFVILYASSENHQHDHDVVINWKLFPRYWPFVKGISGHRWIPLTKTSGWANSPDAGNLRRHGAHCDVIVMRTYKYHDDAMAWRRFLHYGPFVRKIYRTPIPLWYLLYWYPSQLSYKQSSRSCRITVPGHPMK